MSQFRGFGMKVALAALMVFTASSAFGQTINALNATPSGLSQAFIQVGSGEFTLTVNGTGFTASSVVKFGTTSLTTTQDSTDTTTKLTAVVPATLLKTIGTSAITVVDGSNTSNSVDFKVVARGDANADTDVVIGDALAIARSSVGLTKPPLPLSLVDLNFDNNPVVIGDALALARFTVGLETNLRLPTITSATQSGGDISIVGVGFSSTASNNIVLFSKSDGTFAQTAATAVSTDLTTLTVTIPTSAVSGPIFAKRKENGLPSQPFVASLSGSTVPVYISSLSQTTGIVAGTTNLTIVGSGFSTSTDGNTVSFSNSVSSAVSGGVTTFGTATVTGVTVTATSATSLTVTVPSDAVTGYLTVTVGSQTSNKKSIVVSATTTAVLLNHVYFSDAAGETILIEGTGFNQSKPSDNKVIFKDSNGADVSGIVVAAGRTQIVVLVPTGAVTSNIRVETSTNTRVSNGVSFTPASGGAQQAAPVLGTVDLIVTAPSVANQIGSYQATIQFDPNVVFVDALNIAGGTTTGFNTTPGFINVDNVAGTVTIGHFTTTPAAAGTFTLAKIGFSAVAAGTSQLTIDTSVSLVTDRDGTTYTSGATLSLNPTSISVTANQIPIIVSMSPANTAKGAKGFTLTVNGQKFARGATVKFGTTDLSTTYTSGRSLKATVPTDLVATSGSISVLVTNPTVGGGGGASVSTTFNINNPSPEITSISPTSASSGATEANLELTITGKKFVTGSSGTKVLVGGTEWNVTSRTETELKVKPPANTTVTGGVFAVKAKNPTPGGGDSNSKNLTVKGGSGLTADLLIDSPSQAIGGFQVLINYDPKVVSLNASDVDAETKPRTGFAAGFDSTDPITPNIDNTAGSVVLGHLLIQVTTPAVGSGLKVASFNFTPVKPGTSPLSLTVQNVSNVSGETITSDVTVSLSVTSVQVEGSTSPDITSIDPESTRAGSPAEVKVTIEGTNLSKDLVGTFDGKKIGTNFNSDTRMTVTIPASLLKVPGTYPIVLTDGTNSTRALDFVVTDPVDAPVITSLSTTSGTQGTTIETDINGSNLSGATEVTLSGDGVTAAIGAGGSATKLPVAITIGASANTGSRTITVTGPGGATKSSTVTFKVNPAADKSALTLDPSSLSLEAGSASSPVTVSAGSAVAADTIVAIETSNSQIATSPASVTIASGQSSTTFQVKALGAGDATLTLKAGGFSSASLAVNVTPKVSTDPIVESVDPTTRANTAGTFTITIVGSRLKRTDKIEFFAPGQNGLAKDDKLTVAASSITEFDDNGDGDVEKVTAIVTVAAGAKPGTRLVVVTTRDLTSLGNRVLARGGVSTKIGSTANTLVLTGAEARPIIAAVRPNTVVPGQTVDITIVGTNLGSTSTTSVGAFSLDAMTLEPVSDSALSFSGLTVSTSGSTSTISVKLSVKPDAEVGPRAVVVTTADGTSTFELTRENRLEVTGSTERIPVITGVTPASGNTNTTNLDFVIKGSNFTDATSVVFLAASTSGVSVDGKVTTVSALTSNPAGNVLTTKISIASDAAPGARVVVVNTPTGASSAAPSAGNTFAVSGTGNVPAISLLNPNSGAPGQSSLAIAISGSNLDGSSPQVAFLRPTPGGPVIDPDITAGVVTVDSATTANVSITISTSALPGPRIVVFGAGGLISTNHPRSENTFSVVRGGAGQPTITASTPKDLSTGATTQVTITGTNLTNGTLKVLKLQPGGAVEDAKIVVTVVTGSSTATTLVADLNVATDAEPGPKVLLITTTAGTTGGQPEPNNVVRVVKGATGTKPQVTEVSPDTVFPGQTGVAFTIDGSGFTGATSVRILAPAPGGPTLDRFIGGGVISSITVVSDTQITFTANIGDLASGGPRLVQVVGQLSSDDSFGANVFFVDPNSNATTPHIDRAEPGDAAAGQSLLLKVFGQNLSSITRVRILQLSTSGPIDDPAITITGFAAITGGVSVNVTIGTGAVAGPRVIQVANAATPPTVRSSDFPEPGNHFFVRPNIGTGPVVNFVQPQIMPKGATIPRFVLNGTNLAGATAASIQFLKCVACTGALTFGDADAGIVVSGTGFSVDPIGTRIEASLDTTNATVGVHLVKVTIGSESSSTTVTPGNLVLIEKAGGTLIPVITNATPRTLSPGARVTVQLTGNNFTGATELTVLLPFGGGPIEDADFAVSNFSVASNTSASATITVGPDAGPGLRILQITGADANSSDAPNPGNTVDVIVNFAGFGGGPTNTATISSISPTQGNIGQAITTFTVNGTNLTGATDVQFFAPGPFGGPPGPDPNIIVSSLNVVDATKVTATVTFNPGAFVGPHLVVVQTPAGPSPIFADATKNIFSVTGTATTGSVPVITSVNPGGGSVGASNLALTLNGAEFTGATRVTFFALTDAGPKVDTAISVGALTVNSDATQITTTISIGNTAINGPHIIVVSTPVGPSADRPTPGNIFAVGSLTFGGGGPAFSPPNIESVTPSTINAGQSNVEISIKGTSMPSQGGVAFLQFSQGAPVPDPNFSIQTITFTSATEIKVKVNVAIGAAGGPRAVVIYGPSGGSANVPTPLNTILVSGGASTAGSLPEIRNVNPNSDNGKTIGTAFQVAINGNNLASVTELKFLIPTPEGPKPDANITTVIVSATTTSVVANVTINTGAGNGPRFVALKNSAGRSLDLPTPDNTFMVTLFNVGVTGGFGFSASPRVTSIATSAASITPGDTGITLTIGVSNVTSVVDVIAFAPSPGGPVPDINIDIRNVSLSGNTITATMDVAAFAQNGPRAIVVMTPRGPTQNGFDAENSITIGTSTGGAIDFNNLPAIDIMTPQTAVQGQTFTLTIIGRNLTGATGIKFVMPTPEGPASDSTTTASNISTDATGTQVTATITVGTSAVSGPRFVFVQTANGEAGNPPNPGSTLNIGFGAVGAPGGFPVGTGGATISSVAPLEHLADGVQFNLVVTGTNFTSGSSIQFFQPTTTGPVPDPTIQVGTTNFQTSTAVNANVTIPNTAGGGPRFVVVSTPTGPAGIPPTRANTFEVRGGVSMVVPSTGAIITSIGPNTVPSGSIVTGFKILGRNLQGTNQIRFFKFGSTTADTTFTVASIAVNGAGTEVTANVTITNAAEPGPRVVVATATAGTTPAIPGGNVLNIVGNSNGPNIHSVSPTTATPGQPLTLTINGQFLCAASDCAVPPEVLFFAPTSTGPAADNTFTSTISSKTPTSVTVIVNVPSTIAEPQFRLVVVKTSAGRSSDAPSPSNTISFGARTGQPVISSLTPDSIGITSTASATTTVTITIAGSNLLGSSVGFFIPNNNGPAQRDQSIFARVTGSTASSITAEVTMPTRTAGARLVIVTNSNGDNFGQDTPKFLTVTNSNAPTLTSVSPNAKPAGSTFTFTATGTNLGAVTSVKFLIPGATPILDPSITLGSVTLTSGGTGATGTMTIAAGAQPGPRNVLLFVGTTPVLTEPTAANTFFVLGSSDQTAPFLISASPTFLIAGLASQDFFLQGNNLAGTTLKFYNLPAGGNAPTLDTSIIASIDFSASGNSSISADLQIPASATGARIVVVETLSGNNLNQQPPIVVNIGSLVTGTAPHVSSITPNNGNPGASVNVVITGTNFTSDLNRLIVFTSTPAGPQFEPGITVSSFAFSDSTHMTATLTIGSTVLQAPRFLVVAKEGDPTKRSENFANPGNTFNVGTAGGGETGNIPTISSIGPSSHAADGVQFELSISGANLSTVNDIKFIVNGTPDTAFSVSNITFDSATNRVTANVTIASNATSGDHVVVARNSTTGLSTPINVNADFSNVFRVGTETPSGQATITSISPASHEADGVTFSFTVNGSNFGQVAKVLFITMGEHPRSNFQIQILSATVNSEGTQITGTMNIPSTSPTGLHHVVLLKADNTPAGSQPPTEGVNTFRIGSTTVSSGVLTLEKTNGDAQTGPATKALAVPLEVLVTSGGNPAAGVAVSFAVASGNGFVSPGFMLTDSAGKARSSATLGDSPTGTTQTFTAAAGEGSNRKTVTFTATVGTEFTGPIPTEMFPNKAIVGAQNIQMTIRGKNFNSVNAVSMRFGGVNDHSITFTNFNNNLAGTVTVTMNISSSAEVGDRVLTLQTSDGSVYESGAVFKVDAATGTFVQEIRPNFGTVGQSNLNIEIFGNNLSSVTGLKFMINNAPDTAIQVLAGSINTSVAGEVMATLNIGSTAQVGLHRLVLVAGSTEIPTNVEFNVYPAGSPSITFLDPGGANVGQTITAFKINGSNLGGVTNVKFKFGSTIDTALAISNIVINTEKTLITATLAVGNNAQIGQHSVVLSGAPGDFDTGFPFFVHGTGISNVTPNNGTAGTTVSNLTLDGKNLTGVTNLKFSINGINDTALTVTTPSVNSSGTQITVTTLTIGSGAQIGGHNIVLVKGTEEIPTTAVFQVNPASGTATVTSFFPDNGSVGQQGISLTITGSNFGDVTGIRFDSAGTQDTKLTVSNFQKNTENTQITASLNIATDAPTGGRALVLVTASGVINSGRSFQVNAFTGGGGGTFQLNVNKAGTGQGTVISINPSGLIDCGTKCAASTTSGITVTLRATTATGSTFAGWSGACTNTSGDCNITMNESKSVTATFNTSGGGGTGGTISFATAANYADGAVPTDLAVRELNGDNAVDLITANDGTAPGSFSRLMGLPDGTFGTRVDTSIVSQAGVVRKPAIGDLNNDGRLDVVVIGANEFIVTVFLRQADGTWAILGNTSFNTGVADTALRDLNGDDDLDLVVARPNFVSVLLGNGDGTFGTKNDLTGDAAPTSVRIVDVNKDGKMDIVTANGSGTAARTISVFLGQGGGSFAAKQDYTATPQQSNNETGPTALAFADFNADGNIDIAVSSPTAVSVLLGTANGTFPSKTDLTVGEFHFGSSIIAADFNLDGKEDIAVTQEVVPGKVSVFPGLGNGTFGSKIDFATGGGPVAVRAGDFNRDGKADLATANRNLGNSSGSGVSVLLNTTGTQVPAPTLTSITPTAGPQGYRVHAQISGSNFIPNLTHFNVSGDGVVVDPDSVHVLDSNNASVAFKIAPNAATGARNVTVLTAGGTAGPVTFSVNTAPPAPTLTQVNPTSVNRGNTVQVTLTGTNFVAGATGVITSGTGITGVSINVLSSTSLVATAIINSDAALGDRTVFVMTGSGSSNTLTFSVTAGSSAGPSISSINPVSATAPSFAFTTFTINGSGFTQFSTAGPKVVFVRSGTTTTDSRFEVSNIQLVSNTQITFTLNAGSTSFPIDAGTYRVEVRDSITIPTIRTQDTDVTGVNIFTVQAQGAGLAPATFSVVAGQVTAGVDVTVPAPAGTPVNIKAAGAADVSATSFTYSASAVELTRGQTKKLILAGTQIRANAGSVLTISGTGITVSGIEFQTSGLDDLIIAQVAVAADAPLGPRYAMVKNTNDDISILSGGLIIK